MQYRLRTLLVVLALGPPALGFAALSVLRNPVISGVVLGWAVVFGVSLFKTDLKKTYLGLSIAEWLVVLAILMAMAMLAMPVEQAQLE